MATCEYVKVIKVKEDFKDGAWLVTSDDLPGLFLAGGNVAALRKEIPDAIALLFRLNYDMQVVVRPATEEPGLVFEQHKPSYTWAAIPRAAA